MVNQYLTQLIQLNELSERKGEGDTHFLSLLEMLIKNKVVSVSDSYASRSFMMYDGETEEKPLLDYLNKKVQYNSSNSAKFLDFITHHYTDYYDAFSTLNALEEVTRRVIDNTKHYVWGDVHEENKENVEKLKSIVEKMTPDQLKSILLTESYEQKIYDNYKVSEKIYNVRDKFLNLSTVRDIFIEKLEDINFIFDNHQFIEMITIESYDFFENKVNGFWEKSVTVREPVRNHDKDEWEEKVSENKVFELILRLTSNVSERYQNTDYLRKKRSYLYEDVINKVSEETKNKIKNNVSDYIIQNEAPFEVLKLDDWYLYCKEDAFNLFIKKAIEADNSEKIYRAGFFDIITKAEEDKDFQTFLLKHPTSLFTLLLKNDRKTRFEYFDRSFKIDPRSTEILLFSDTSRSEMHIKLSRLVKKYGVENLLGGMEKQKELAYDLLNMNTHGSQTSYSGSRRKPGGIKLIENLSDIVSFNKASLNPELVSVVEIAQMLSKLVISKTDVPVSEYPEKIFVDMERVKNSAMMKSASFNNKEDLIQRLTITYEKTLLNKNLNVEHKETLKNRL